MSQLDEDMTQTKQALIDIIGKEATDEIMASKDKVGAIKKNNPQLKKKQKSISKMRKMNELWHVKHLMN